ncbi:unnamed protein product, partial [Rotaria sp. Silwood2]
AGYCPPGGITPGIRGLRLMLCSNGSKQITNRLPDNEQP